MNESDRIYGNEGNRIKWSNLERCTHLLLVCGGKPTEIAG
jgi:hypothetical protein